MKPSNSVTRPLTRTARKRSPAMKPSLTADYPIVGDPDHGTVSLQRVSDHEIKVTVKKGNKVDSELDVVISKHGRTATSKYTDYSQGKPQKGIAIYEKQ